ncbi:hypothetical protein RAA17_20905 [Komagataeibacter rhaeticus]|nr:hypothetical protein [Komagataeibacter rhaeticus]
MQVDYNVQPDGVPEPKAVRTWFAYNGGLMRIDSPQGMGETILNRMSRQVTIIINPQKVYSQLDARYGIRNPFLLDLSMSFVRKGHRVWRVLPARSGMSRPTRAMPPPA